MATPSPVYGADGECGVQHNNALCIPQQGRSCCSKNGCLAEYGCQSGCVDASEFPSTTVTPTPSPSPSTSLTGKERAGVIVGCIFFGLIVIVVIYYLYLCKPPPRRNKNIIFRHEEANGTTKVLELPLEYANRNPGFVNQAALALTQDTLAGNAENARPSRGLPMPGPWTRHSTSSNAHYGNDPDDQRFEEV